MSLNQSELLACLIYLACFLLCMNYFIIFLTSTSLVFSLFSRSRTSVFLAMAYSQAPCHFENICMHTVDSIRIYLGACIQGATCYLPIVSLSY